MNRLLSIRLKTKFYNIVRFVGPVAAMLGVGVVNRRAPEMKLVLAGRECHGVDRAFTFGESERARFDRFKVIDLEVDPLASVAESAYDLVVVNHVLEHVANDPPVVGNAIRCLRLGGVLCLEVPSLRSLSHAAARWHYHFHDDSTHKPLYSLEELCNAVTAAGGKVLECGIAKTPLKWLLSLPRAVLGLMLRHSAGHLFVQSRKEMTRQT